MVGSWTTYTEGQAQYDFYQNGSGRAKQGGGGSATGTFQPNLPESGDYEVFAWLDRRSDGATNLPFTIYNTGGPTTVTVNTRLDPPTNGGWVSLGSYTFPTGTSGEVVVSDNATGGWVIADAIRWYKPGTPTNTPIPSDTPTPSDTPVASDTPTVTNTSSAPAILILDGGSPTGGWVNYTSGQIGYDFYGGSGLVKLAGSGSATVTFQPNMPKTAAYEVFIWVDKDARGATNMLVNINHAGGTTPVLVDIKNAAFTSGGWLSLGTYTFNVGTGGTVVMTDQASSGYVIADAVRWVEVP